MTEDQANRLQSVHLYAHASAAFCTSNSPNGTANPARRKNSQPTIRSARRLPHHSAITFCTRDISHRGPFLLEDAQDHEKIQRSTSYPAAVVTLLSSLRTIPPDSQAHVCSATLSKPQATPTSCLRPRTITAPCRVGGPSLLLLGTEHLATAHVATLPVITSSSKTSMLPDR